jgi:uncharacterized protein (TIGR00730 family)
MKEIKNICVFCSSSNKVVQEFKDAAHETGRILAEQGYHMVFGGGRLGLMGISADAALKAGGTVTGVTTVHLHEMEMAHPHLTELYVVDTMHQRKAMMEGRSDAFVILPGGFGTLEELFEILTAKQIGLLDKPIIFVNTGGFFNALEALMQDMLRHKVIMKEHLDLYTIVDHPDQIIRALECPKKPFDPTAKWREELALMDKGNDIDAK